MDENRTNPFGVELLGQNSIVNQVHGVERATNKGEIRIGIRRGVRLKTTKTVILEK